MIRVEDERKALVAELLESDAWHDVAMSKVGEALAHNRYVLAGAARDGDIVTSARYQGKIDGVVELIETLYKYLGAEIPSATDLKLRTGPAKRH